MFRSIVDWVGVRADSDLAERRQGPPRVLAPPRDYSTDVITTGGWVAGPGKVIDSPTRLPTN
jgi:hypothetical protein